MFRTNTGSWKKTGRSAIRPRSESDTDRSCTEMVMSIRPPSMVGKLVTARGWLSPSQLFGTPRPTMSAPSDRWATNESRRTLLAPAIPQAWGDEPWPAAGCRPTHEVVGEGAVELSHQDIGPLWLLAIMNW